MPGLFHKVTYGSAALAAILHMAFAAVAAQDAKITTDVANHNNDAFRKLGVEGLDEPCEKRLDDGGANGIAPPHEVYGMAIFRSVIAAISMVYYLSQYVFLAYCLLRSHI